MKLGMDMDTQVILVYALTGLHNFIRQNATHYDRWDMYRRNRKGRQGSQKERMPNCQTGPLFLARRKGKKMDDYRDAIAAAMWALGKLLCIYWKIAMKNELLLSLPPLLTRYHIEIQCHVTALASATKAMIPSPRRLIGKVSIPARSWWEHAEMLSLGDRCQGR
jgi:hypothetical protein